MKNIKTKFLNTLIFIFLLMSCNIALASGEIDKIVITNNKRVENSTILSYLQIVEGDRYNSQKINNSIKQLYQTGLFSNIQISKDGNVLNVIVTENPTISKIAFEGNKRVKDDDLKGEIILKSRSVYTRSKVQNDVKRILDIYRKKGRFDVKVDPKAIALDNNRINLVFEVDEGKKAVVTKVYFIGNDFMSTRRLKRVVNTREYNLFNFYTNSASYDPDKLEYDRELIRRFYRSKGFADIKVKSATAELTHDKSSFIVTFNIEEGNRYKFGEVNIESSLQELRSELLNESISTLPDERFNSNQVETTIEDMTEQLNEMGYAFVDIDTIYDRDPHNKIMGITYRIKEGPKVYINNINVAGNVRTLDRVVRREFRIAEGDPFNSAKIRRSKQRIENLGFFEKVDIKTAKTNNTDKADINVEVEEKSTGELNFGAGFSTTDGALGNVSIRERNLLGKGQDLRLSFQKSSRGNNINLGFTEPYFMGKEVSAGFDIFSNSRDNEDESSFDSEIEGLALRTSYPITEHLSHRLRYTYRDVNITDVPTDASIFIRQQVGETSTSEISNTLVYDKLDNKFTPTEGYRVKYDFDFAGIGGDTKYIRNELEASYYKPLYKEDVILKLAASSGYIHGLDGDDVRINDRFFIGGTKIRGFDNSGIGPRDNGTRQDALGGNIYYAVTAEATFPFGLPDEVGIKGKAFIDAGSLYDSDDEGSSVRDDSSIRASAGLGLMWKSPLGPIGITYAVPFAKESYDDTKRVDFNFGTRF